MAAVEMRAQRAARQSMAWPGELALAPELVAPPSPWEDVRSHLQDIENRFFDGIPVRYPLRTKVKIKLQNSREGRLWDAFQTVLSLTACVIYVVETYEVEVAPVVEMVFTVCFTVDYVLRLYAADSRLAYPLTLNALVDLVTIAPVYIEHFTENSSNVSLFSFFRFVRVLRVMRILRAFKILNQSFSAVDRQLFTLVLTVASIVFLSAGLVQMVEDQMYETLMGFERGCDPDDYLVDTSLCSPEHVTFGDSLYFIIVTISTVGYGDIAPQTDPGKVIVSGMLVVSLILVPMQVNQLTLLLAMQSPFRRHYSPDATVPHVLVVGYVSNTAVLHDFFTEFFHPDRFVLSADCTIQNTAVIIMAPHEPSEELQALIMNPIIENKVFYVKGSVMNEEDLYRVAADEAVACFILCDKTSPYPKVEDSQTVLRALVLENFNPAMDTLVQLNSPKHRNQLIQADADRVLCIDEMKMHILAQSAVSPGLSTLVSNLFRSTVSMGEDEEVWRAEYLQGCDLEVYCVRLPPILRDLSFLDAYKTIYDAFLGQVLLIGVEEREMTFDDDDRAVEDIVTMLVNPGHSFSLDASAVLYGYVLASDGGVADSIQVEDAYDVTKVRSLRSRQVAPPARNITELQRDLVPEQPLVVRDVPLVVLEDARRQGVCNHVLIVATLTLDNLECLLSPLRAPHSIMLPVVLLTPRCEGQERRCLQELSARLGRMAEIYIVFREGDQEVDLFRAGVETARTCLILADRTTTKEIDGTTLDHSIIFHHLALEHMLVQNATNLSTLVELSSSSTMKVMNNTTIKRLRQLNQLGREAAALSGEEGAEPVVVPRQGRRNPSATTDSKRGEASTRSIRSIFVQSEKARKAKGRQKQRAELKARRKKRSQVTFGTAEHSLLPFFAAGNGFSTDMFDNLICQTFYTPELLRFTEIFLAMDYASPDAPPQSPGAADSGAVSSFITQIPVPSPLVHHTFAALTEFLTLEFQAIPFGIYRAAVDAVSLPYVYTGPAPDTLLHANDRVFVLAPRSSRNVNELVESPSTGAAPPVARRGSFSSSATSSAASSAVERPPRPPPAPAPSPSTSGSGEFDSQRKRPVVRRSSLPDLSSASSSSSEASEAAPETKISFADLTASPLSPSAAAAAEAAGAGIRGSGAKAVEKKRRYRHRERRSSLNL